MAYAKKCKYCNTVQVVWDEHLQGPNKFKEVQTNQPHTRERCDQAKNTPVEQQVPMYNPQEQKQFVDMYRPQQQPAKQDTKFDSQKIDVIEAQYQRLYTKVDNMNIALAQIMSNVTNIIENAGTFKEMQELKTENQQLKEVIKKQNLSFKPANEISQQQDTELQTEHDQHVRDMVAKGKQATEEEEELDLT